MAVPNAPGELIVSLISRGVGNGRLRMDQIVNWWVLLCINTPYILRSMREQTLGLMFFFLLWRLHHYEWRSRRRVRSLFFNQLWLSTEHHEQSVSMPPPHGEPSPVLRRWAIPLYQESCEVDICLLPAAFTWFIHGTLLHVKNILRLAVIIRSMIAISLWVISTSHSTPQMSWSSNTDNVK